MTESLFKLIIITAESQWRCCNKISHLSEAYLSWTSSLISTMTRFGSKFFVISSRAFSGIMSAHSHNIHSSSCMWKGFYRGAFIDLTPSNMFSTSCKNLRWWLTIQCAASSFSSGTSNRAGLKSSSRAVGLLQGSRWRHFWISSCKNKHWSHTSGNMNGPFKLTHEA